MKLRYLLNQFQYCHRTSCALQRRSNAPCWLAKNLPKEFKYAVAHQLVRTGKVLRGTHARDCAWLTASGRTIRKQFRGDYT